LQVVPSVFVPDIEAAVQDFVAKWQDRDESLNFAQRYDPDLVRDELRPLVFEQVRKQVDDEMRVLLENLKVSTALTSLSGLTMKCNEQSDVARPHCTAHHVTRAWQSAEGAAGHGGR
jgi:hypothetical protein